MKIARRLTDLLARALEDGSGERLLDPDQATLYEALQAAVHAPLASRASMLAGLEGSTEGTEERGFQGKPLCASVAGFSLHAAQAVSAEDRAGLETLCRYGLRPAFSQRRLSLSADGRVVYELRRPWPNERGATHLLLEPKDFLRRLAALIPAPYSHQARYFGVFANHSSDRRRLPRPPAPGGSEGDGDPCERRVSGRATTGHVTPGAGSSAGRRSRLPWAQLLRRVLSVDALSCPRCSSREEAVPLVVLAFLSDPEVVAKILAHLGLPTTPPALSPARGSAPQLFFGPGPACSDGGMALGEDAGPEGEEESEGFRGEGVGQGRAPPEAGVPP